jgi:hypothetical protein
MGAASARPNQRFLGPLRVLGPQQGVFHIRMLVFWRSRLFCHRPVCTAALSSCSANRARPLLSAPPLLSGARLHLLPARVRVCLCVCVCVCVCVGVGVGGGGGGRAGGDFRACLHVHVLVVCVRTVLRVFAAALCAGRWMLPQRGDAHCCARGYESLWRCSTQVYSMSGARAGSFDDTAKGRSPRVRQLPPSTLAERPGSS